MLIFEKSDQRIFVILTYKYDQTRIRTALFFFKAKQINKQTNLDSNPALTET